MVNLIFLGCIIFYIYWKKKKEQNLRIKKSLSWIIILLRITLLIKKNKNKGLHFISILKKNKGLYILPKKIERASEQARSACEEASSNKTVSLAIIFHLYLTIRTIFFT